MSKLVELYSQLKKLENLDPTKLTEFVKTSEKRGRQLYQTNSEMRDLCTVMEHPEFYSFYYKYMQSFERFKRIIVLMKLYDIISHKLLEMDPAEKYHNAYHKLIILYNFIHNCDYKRILFGNKKQTYELLK